jgi:hypothetical protein
MSSLCDEFGEPRADFALADVLGVHHRGIPAPKGAEPQELDVNFARNLNQDYWEKRRNIWDFVREPDFPFESDGLRSLIGAGPYYSKVPPCE